MRGSAAARGATLAVAQAAARVSRLEGMEAHARTGDVRLEKNFSGRRF